MKTIEIFRERFIVNGNKYEFIIKEGYGLQTKRRPRPRFYEIRKNGKCVLYTSLHQTFYSYKKKILNN